MMFRYMYADRISLDHTLQDVVKLYSRLGGLDLQEAWLLTNLDLYIFHIELYPVLVLEINC